MELFEAIQQRASVRQLRPADVPEGDLERVLDAGRRARATSGALVPSSPWENGYLESFDGKLHDELLHVEIFDTLREAQVLVERWRSEYNTVRPHRALNYRPPAPEAVQPWPAGCRTDTATGTVYAGSSPAC